MVDAIISIVADRVTAIIEDQIHYQVNLIRGVKKEVVGLSNKLKTIRDVLDDAEKRGVKDQSVQNWLKKLEDTAYDMDDILDEWKYAILKHKQKVCCSLVLSSCLCFKKVVVRRDTSKKIQNVKARLDQILKEKDDFNFVMSLPVPPTDHVPNSWRVQSTSSIELEKVCGRDEDRNCLVRKLMLNGGDRQIMSIVGMGGIGKTTLAQLVYNDTQVKDCFELRIWICASDPFDVDGIARGIVDSVGKEMIPPNTNQLDLVLHKLRDSIKGKKFLLVLDDVWTEDYNKWEPLKINLKHGAPASKILVTTRNKRVANMMGTSDNEIYFPQQLTDEDCWRLLRHISLSGRGDEECREFEDVGHKIARKCKGLPLAANVLGSLLQFKDNLEEWENVLESEIWQLEKAEVELFPHLLLSYNELSPTLKRCFSYCAIYPKDLKINVKGLIEGWMALGYLGSVSENGGVELKGREYFNKLAMSSLFQDFEISHEQIKWCKMHDIVHDFARFVKKNNGGVEAAEVTKRGCQMCDHVLVSQAKEYRSVFWGEGSPTNICGCVTSLRVFRIKWGLFGPPPRGMERLIHLRWLKLSGSKVSMENLKIICKLHFLQSLLLACCSLKEIPAEIGNLVDLRHLNLSSNEKLTELPENMCSLLKLHTLLLACCSLEEIPNKIGNLVHLRHLDVSGNTNLKELPESLCRLLELQILNIECCSDLYGLPEGIHGLESLQHLLIEHTPASCRFPQGLAQLKGLHTLSSFHGGSGCNKLGLLKHFHHLSGTLKLEIHGSSSSDVEVLVEDAREADLRSKTHIQRLDVQFYDELMDEKELSSASLLWIDVIEALQPNQKLQKLKIWGFRGSKLPHWMSSPLNLLKEITLIELSEVESLPPMGKLPFLEVLYIKQITEMKLVGRELLGVETSSSSSFSSSDDVVAFPKLKGLTFSGCHKWREWEDITAEEEESEEEESVTFSVMPCLTRLSINWCEGMKKLPHRLLRKASSLQMLSVEHSLELVKSYGDKNGCFWRSITQNNSQLQLQL